VKSKPVIPRELANQDVNEAVEYYLSKSAEQAALGFIEALEQAYAHIGRHRNAIAAGHPHFHLVVTDSRKLKLPARPDNPLGG